MTSTRIASPAPASPQDDAAALGRPHGSASRSRELWRVGAISIIWITSLLVAALWVAGGGMQTLLQPVAGTLDSLGRITGLVSANLLLHQVLLMARVPVFERGLGRDAIVRMHRFVGFWSFWLLLAHIALITLGYAIDSGLQPLVQLWQLVWGLPGMLLATVATLLMVLVVVTSIRRARRRLRYESWHLLHLYAYLGVALAVPHMLWTGTDLGAAPASTYWLALWISAAASVVVFRIVVPLTRSLRLDLRVVAVERDGSRGVRVRVRSSHPERVRAVAGQFLIWRFLDGAGWMRGHPFSLAEAPSQGELVLAARIVGDGTKRLLSLRPGTRVLVEGPYGVSTGAARRGTRLLMIGAGAGVAPLLGLLESEAYAPGTAVLVARDHVDHEAIGAEHVARLVRERGVRHVPLAGPRATGESSWLPAIDGRWDGAVLLRDLGGDPADLDVYVCGPGPWMDAVLDDLARAGVAPDRIHTESFTS